MCLIYTEKGIKNEDVPFSRFKDKIAYNSLIVREAAVSALGIIFLEQTINGMDPDLSSLEEELDAESEEVRAAAVSA